MKSRQWQLIGALAILALVYLFFFTDWLRPVPIEILSQVRVAVQNPHFGRTVVKKLNGTNRPPQLDKLTKIQATVRTKKTDEEAIRETAGDVAHVTFTLDDAYRLTHLQVEDIPADGTPPKVLWLLKGKSFPVRSLIYGVGPEGMAPVLAGTEAEPLKPGVPYRLTIESGRRRGSTTFTTVPRPID